MQLVDQRCCEVFANDALPLTLATTEVCFVLLQEVHEAHADVLLEQLTHLLGLSCEQFGNLYDRFTNVLLTMIFTSSMFMSECLTLNLGRSASGSFYTYSSSSSIGKL